MYEGTQREKRIRIESDYYKQNSSQQSATRT
jgi:hypothetical protein